jgi:hypothetical protein
LASAGIDPRSPNGAAPIRRSSNRAGGGVSFTGRGLTGLVTLGLFALPGAAHALPATAHEPPGAGRALPTPDDPVVVVGSVVNREGDEPIAGARVRFLLVEEEQWTEVQTDQDGQFVTPPLEEGLYLLRVEHLGFTTLDRDVEVYGPSPLTISVSLAHEAIEVEGLVVVIRLNPFLEESGFYDRRRAGLGLTYTRQEIEVRRIFRMTDLFRTIAGVSFDHAGSPTSPFLVFRQGCLPDIVIDGANLGPAVRLDDYVVPSEAQGIEVYRGTSTLPSEYSASECGAVLVWTQTDRPEDAGPLTWTRIIFGVALLGLVQLIRP